MYQITSKDRQILLLTDPTDDIQRLQPVLGNETILVLTKYYGIERIHDLVKFEPIQFATIGNLSAGEREKLEAVYFHLFQNAFENLHG